MQTKLYIPQQPSNPTRGSIIPRLRLLDKLNGALHCKFALISAPTGFGKTTVVAAWLSQLTAVSPTWLSLDKNDNDPTRFLTYFIHALRGAEPSLGESALLTLQSTPTLAAELLLTAVLNEISTLTQPLILVLDDFHVIDNKEIDQIVQFILQNQPPTLHLIITSRTQPSWPLARWRARGDMVELRGDDLRFTLEETALFLNTIMGFSLSSAQIKELDERIEGWVAGLQMAALSMRGRHDINSFIHAFSGSHHLILDYLMEEVLTQQSPATQEFLVQSSILDRLNGSLCDAVLGRTDSQEMLVTLARANLFLLPLDDTRRWYRYHHLFGELLSARLHETNPEKTRPLQIKASEWYERNGFIDEAIRYALTAADYERVARIIAANALAMAYHGELQTLLGWLHVLPNEMVQKRPWLLMAHAWALGFLGQIDAAEREAQKAEQLATKIKTANPQQLAGYITLVHSYCAGMRVEPERSTELATTALNALPEDDWLARGMATLFLAQAQGMKGNLTTSALLYAKAATLSQTSKDPHFIIDVLWERSVLESRMGQLHQTMATCQATLEIAHTYSAKIGRLLPVQAYIYERMSDVLLEWNDLPAALHYAQEAYALSQRWGQADAIVTSSTRLAFVLTVQGDTENALRLMNEAVTFVQGLSRWYELTMGSVKATVLVADGQIETAVKWLKTCDLNYSDHLDSYHRLVYLRISKILVAAGNLSEAEDLLARLLLEAESAGAMYTVVITLILQALTYQGQNRRDLALATIARALTLAEPQGYVRSFIDEGAAMEKLLTQTAVSGHSVVYVGKLLAAMAHEKAELSIAPSPLVEPFSQRELQVLRLLATPLSSIEIAEQLVIAPSTVRSHIKNIYRKLDVHKRVTAVQCAQKLGFI